ncbi:hypothetical protein [Lysobacter gummosus]
MRKRTLPAVPLKLRESLKSYPGHVERLHEILDEFAKPKLR